MNKLDNSTSSTDDSSTTNYIKETNRVCIPLFKKAQNNQLSTSDKVNDLQLAYNLAIQLHYNYQCYYCRKEGKPIPEQPTFYDNVDRFTRETEAMSDEELKMLEDFHK